MGEIANWIIHNKEWVFSGIGIPLLAWLFSKKEAKKAPQWQQKSGDGAVNIQVGGNVTVHNDAPKQIADDPMTGQIGSEFIPLQEAATRFYEESRATNSIWAYAAEKLGAHGFVGQSSPDEVLNWTANYIAGKIDVYGSAAPSTVIEIIPADTHVTFFNAATACRKLVGNHPTFINLQVKRADLERVLAELQNGVKTDTLI